MAILRRGYLETELLMKRIEYDRYLRTRGLVAETEKRAIDIVLKTLELDIKSIEKEIESINQK